MQFSLNHCFYSSYSQAQYYQWDSTKRIWEKIPIPVLQKTLQSMLLGGEVGGSGRGDLKEVRFMVVLLVDGIYRTLALLLILIFDFYMILCSCQIIYLNNCSV